MQILLTLSGWVKAVCHEAGYLLHRCARMPRAREGMLRGWWQTIFERVRITGSPCRLRVVTLRRSFQNSFGDLLMREHIMDAIPVPDAPETEDQLIATAQQAVSCCNWVVGECASKWTVKYAKGRTDADFGVMVGLSGDQVYQRRRVWETFGDVVNNYASLKWSHFYAVLTWEDAPELLQWADENEATIAEMKAWRRLQRGEEPEDASTSEAAFAEYPISYLPSELTSVREPTDQGTTGSGVSPSGSDADRSRDPNLAPAARDTSGAGEYTPFRSDAATPAPAQDTSDVAVAERPQPSAAQVVGRMTKMLERCSAVLTPEFVNDFRHLPEAPRNGFLKAVRELSSKVSELM